MRNLFAASMHRLKKELPFLLLLAAMVLLGTILVLSSFINYLNYEEITNLEDIFFIYMVVIGIVIAAFSSLFLGTEYSDGTLRNKLVCGHSRTAVYLSNLLTVILAALLLCIAFFIPMLALGIPLLGTFSIAVPTIVLLVLCSFVTVITLCAIFTAIGMQLQNKALSAIVSLFLMLLLLVAALLIKKMLDAPEYNDMFEINLNGEVQPVSEPNPHYLTGTERAVYQCIYDFLPSGQALQYMMAEVKMLWRLVVFAIATTVLVSAVGVRLFTRKDLK